MRVRKSFKDPSGKYVSIDVDVGEGCVINYLEVSGDFFADPPEVIDELSLGLLPTGNPVELLAELERRLESVKLVGVSKDTLLRLLKECFEELRECREKLE